MTSSRPYLIRALYEWILDNNCTPYVLVNAHDDGVEVPLEHVNKDGQIILNVAPTAVQDLLIRNEDMEFKGRFGGIPTRIFFPILSVAGIYAKENGQGMIFEIEPRNPDPSPPDPAPKKGPEIASTSSGSSTEKSKKGQGRPSLRVVK